MVRHKAICPDSYVITFARSSHQCKILHGNLHHKRRFFDDDSHVEWCDGVCRVQQPVQFLPYYYHTNIISGCQWIKYTVPGIIALKNIQNGSRERFPNRWHYQSLSGLTNHRRMKVIRWYTTWILHVNRRCELCVGFICYTTIMFVLLNCQSNTSKSTTFYP